MPVAQDDILKAVWKVNHTSPNTKIQNVFYWRVSDFASDDAVDTALDMIGRLIAAYTLVAAQLSVRYVLESVRCTNETKKEFMLDDDGAGFTGSDAINEVFPGQDTGLVIARSLKLGHQGRKYVGPLTETSATNGTLTGPALTALQNFANNYDNQFVGAASANTLQPCTVQFGAGGGVVAFTDFEAGLGSVLTEMRTQRRRRPGVGLS